MDYIEQQQFYYTQHLDASFRRNFKSAISDILNVWPEAGIEANTDGVTVARTAPSVQQKPPRPELD